MTPVVYVRRNAFWAMIVTSVEMFKRECFGLLFGSTPSKSRHHFIITKVHSSQYPKKLHTGVLEHARSERRLKEFFLRMPHSSQPIGSFHSHTERAGIPYVPEMSETDIQDTERRQSKIECIIGITSRKKGTAEWRANDDGSITGSCGSGRYNYNFNVNAYILEYRDNKPVPVRIKIIAPQAIRALNRALGYY